MTQVSDKHLAQTGAVLSALLLEAKAVNPSANRLMICYDAPVEDSAPHWQIDIVSGLPGWGYTDIEGEGATLAGAVADARQQLTPQPRPRPSWQPIDELCPHCHKPYGYDEHRYCGEDGKQ